MNAKRYLDSLIAFDLSKLLLLACLLMVLLAPGFGLASHCTGRSQYI
jgi:hypothetical protein